MLWVHVAGGFDHGRQACLRCGVLLITTRLDEIGGVAQWPPPWPVGSHVVIELDEFYSVQYAGAVDDPGPAVRCPQEAGQL
jgi:hypothetical protein